jgi:hypothetical protein
MGRDTKHTRPLPVVQRAMLAGVRLAPSPVSGILPRFSSHGPNCRPMAGPNVGRLRVNGPAIGGLCTGAGGYERPSAFADDASARPTRTVACRRPAPTAGTVELWQCGIGGSEKRFALNLSYACSLDSPQRLGAKTRLAHRALTDPEAVERLREEARSPLSGQPAARLVIGSNVAQAAR